MNIYIAYIRKGDFIVNQRKNGAKHEEIASKYLENKGFQILCRNFFCKYAEIDIIAKDGEYLVFCEVKFRQKTSTGMPVEAVNFVKQKNMTMGALYYMSKNHIPPDTNLRFDVISILDNKITHYRNAFEPIEW